MRATDLSGRCIVSRFMLAAGFILYGCATDPDSARNPTYLARAAALPPAQTHPAAVLPPTTAGGTAGPVSTLIDARPAAIVDGNAVGWGDLRPILNELAGSVALQEVVLDRKLTEALTAAGITI